MKIESRKADVSDIAEILELISGASRFLRENNVDQWQNDCPSEELILGDIKKGNGYVFFCDDKMCAYSMIGFYHEFDYDEIYDGKWIDDDIYAVLHRVAVADGFRGMGIGGKIIEIATDLAKEKGKTSLRIDTHKDNLAMQRMLEKAGFTYCGRVYVSGTLERIAFNKVI